MGILGACFCAVIAIMSAQRNGWAWANNDQPDKVASAIFLGCAVGGVVFFLWPHVQL